MTNRFFDPERPPVGDFWGRFDLLERLAEFHFEGPMGYYANEDTEAPAEYLRLEELRTPAGNREAYIIYATQAEWAPSPDSPLIRHVLWRRDIDRNLSQHGCVLWPDIDVTLYRVPRDLMTEMDSLTADLGIALSKRRHYGLSLGLSELYVTGPPDEIPAGEMIPPGSPWRTVDFLGEKVRYIGRTAQPEIDTAFGRVWDFCKASCTSLRRVTYAEKHFRIGPEVYRAGIHHMMSLLDLDQ